MGRRAQQRLLPLCCLVVVVIGSTFLARSSVFCTGAASASLRSQRTDALQVSTVLRAGSADQAAQAGPVWIPFGGGSNYDVRRVLGPDSSVEVLEAEMPLGLQIAKMEQESTFIIQSILPGGAASMGTLDVQVGDVIHATSTTEEGDRKTLVEASSCDLVEDFQEAIMRNEDGMVSLVVEKATQTGSPIAWMEGVARMW